MSALTPSESVRLCELERVIQKGKDTFVEVGNALAEIRDSRMYRATFKTFDDYCKDRWGLNKQTAYQLIEGAAVTENLKSHKCDELPQNQGQTRPLAKLPADKQPEAWTKAQEKAKEEGKPVAARHVEQAVAEVMQPDEPDPVVVDESKTARRAPMRVIESEGMNIWRIAKAQLDRINKNDEFREEALKSCIEYCKARLKNRK